MTIAEASNLKLQMEQKVAAMLSEFEQQTQMRVEYVRFERVYSGQIYTVNIEVKLP